MPPAVTENHDDLLGRVATGDDAAFAALYDQFSPRVYGLVKRVVVDAAQAEEVTQEALLEVWRNARRYEPSKGSAASWVMTIAHRRAVDRVRSEQASAERTRRAATADPPYDQVIEETIARIEQRQVRHCLRSLTTLQRQSVLLAYYGGYTYSEVAGLLGSALPTIKTRMRDGLIRLRDCLGATGMSR